jgi:hypothetical protein
MNFFRTSPRMVDAVVYLVRLVVEIWAVGWNGSDQMEVLADGR